LIEVGVSGLFGFGAVDHGFLAGAAEPVNEGSAARMKPY
jgi:hypothetical protein